MFTIAVVVLLALAALALATLGQFRLTQPGSPAPATRPNAAVRQAPAWTTGSSIPLPSRPASVPDPAAPVVEEPPNPSAAGAAGFARPVRYSGESR